MSSLLSLSMAVRPSRTMREGGESGKLRRSEEVCTVARLLKLEAAAEGIAIIASEVLEERAKEVIGRNVGALMLAIMLVMHFWLLRPILIVNAPLVRVA